MSPVGQKATSRHTKKNSRFRGLSSRPMSAFLAEGDFVPSLPAHPLRADATADPSFGRLIAKSGNSKMDMIGPRNSKPTNPKFPSSPVATVGSLIERLRWPDQRCLYRPRSTDHDSDRIAARIDLQRDVFPIICQPNISGRVDHNTGVTYQGIAGVAAIG